MPVTVKCFYFVSSVCCCLLILVDVPMCLHLWACVFLRGLNFVAADYKNSLYSYLPRYNIRTLSSLFSDFILLISVVKNFSKNVLNPPDLKKYLIG